jgi:CHAT domain
MSPSSSKIQSSERNNVAMQVLDNQRTTLLLGDGRITLGQLISPGWRFQNLNEVFMSCCETNLGDQNTFADQPLTLSTGYLCAGARGVIGTLWSVRGKRGIRKKSYAKCENSAHSDVKCTLIMTTVLAL